MSFDAVKLHWLWRETNSRLERYRGLVRQRASLAAAADFARYVQQCGLVDIFKAFPAPEPLLVDGNLILGKAKELEAEVCELWRSGAVVETRDTQLEDIHHKLDLIAGQLSRIPVGQAVSQPLTFPVLQGGEKS